MKVMLIDPLMESAHTCPSLGLMYLAATLERGGFPVKIVEMRFLENPWINLRKIISKEEPDVVGITTMSYTFPASLKIAQITKNAVPNSVIVLGGPHATFMSVEILAINPEVDLVVIGEGEYTMLELIKTLTESGSLKRIRGITLLYCAALPNLSIECLIFPTVDCLNSFPPHQIIFYLLQGEQFFCPMCR